ncbi:MAG: glyoxalase [Lewinellaceae bacterium]|nr:glyoxalase [Lewinellaceae bacterium]
MHVQQRQYMRDDQQLLLLRPELQLPARQSGPEEQFQNQTLRPILKMQHTLLARMFFAQILQHKSIFFQLSAPARQEWIANNLRSNTRLRQLLAGAIIGHFTLEEYHLFETNQAENMRRLTSLLTQRLQSVDFEAMLKR